MTSPALLYTPSAGFNVRAIMAAAVQAARMLPAVSPWTRRMSSSLQLAWRWAKAAKATAAERAAVALASRKLVLDRGRAIALIARMEALPFNRGRDLRGEAAKLEALDDVLQLARAEFRALPPADRPAILASLTGGSSDLRTPARLGGRPNLGTPARRHTFMRGSRVHSHGW